MYAHQNSGILEILDFIKVFIKKMRNPKDEPCATILYTGGLRSNFQISPKIGSKCSKTCQIG